MNPQVKPVLVFVESTQESLKPTEMEPGQILFLSKSDVEGCLSMKDVLDVVEEVFRLNGEGKVIQPPKTYLGEGMRFIVSMPCAIAPMGPGLKWISLNIDNPKKNIPLLTGVVALSDRETFRPLCVMMEGGIITSLRTAGHAGVAAKYLAKRDSSKLAIIGCGQERRTHLKAMNELFDLDLVNACDIRNEALTQYVREMGHQLGLKIVAAESPKDAVESADIVCMVTTSTKPVVFDEWISPGCFVAGTQLFYDLESQAKQDR